MSAPQRLSAICLLLLCAAPLAVRAEEANAKSIDTAPADVAVRSALRATQIEPMVAPVKRSAPQTPDNRAKALSVQGDEASRKSGKKSEAPLKKQAGSNAKVADQEQPTPKSSTKKLAKKNR